MSRCYLYLGQVFLTLLKPVPKSSHRHDLRCVCSVIPNPVRPTMKMSCHTCSHGEKSHTDLTLSSLKCPFSEEMLSFMELQGQRGPYLFSSTVINRNSRGLCHIPHDNTRHLGSHQSKCTLKKRCAGSLWVLHAGFVSALTWAPSGCDPLSSILSYLKHSF